MATKAKQDTPVQISAPTTGRIEYNGISAQWVQTSKEICSEWLQSMPDFQRPPSAKRLRSMTRDAISGVWQVTGVPLIFDDQGRLIDGQHRCRIFLASEHFPVVLVVSGVKPVAFTGIDRVLPRSPSAEFKARGIKNYSRMASVAIRFAITDEGFSQGEAVSVQEALDAYYRHERILEDCLNRWRDLEHLITPTNRHYLAAQIIEKHGEEVASKFFDALITGIGPQPIMTLRKRLMSEAAKPGRGRMESREQLALMIKAFNAWRDNRSLGLIKWVIGEEFPKLSLK
jgi:hypothetical protein